MPQLVIPDIDPTTLELLRQRAADHAQSVEIEAMAILAGALAASCRQRPLGRRERHAGESGPIRARIPR